mmetsp:Transcript_51929/g.161128  ORF Transcript_51929/g.161128 Transcript_51929/m.161128 type:complete len:421 (-) Transcript_51929:171-1433(-)
MLGIRAFRVEDRHARSLLLVAQVSPVEVHPLDRGARKLQQGLVVELRLDATRLGAQEAAAHQQRDHAPYVIRGAPTEEDVRGSAVRKPDLVGVGSVIAILIHKDSGGGARLRPATVQGAEEAEEVHVLEEDVVVPQHEKVRVIERKRPLSLQGGLVGQVSVQVHAASQPPTFGKPLPGRREDLRRDPCGATALQGYGLFHLPDGAVELFLAVDLEANPGRPPGQVVAADAVRSEAGVIYVWRSSVVIDPGSSLGLAEHDVDVDHTLAMPVPTADKVTQASAHPSQAFLVQEARGLPRYHHCQGREGRPSGLGRSKLGCDGTRNAAARGGGSGGGMRSTAPGAGNDVRGIGGPSNNTHGAGCGARGGGGPSGGAHSASAGGGGAGGGDGCGCCAILMGPARAHGAQAEASDQPQGQTEPQP